MDDHSTLHAKVSDKTAHVAVIGLGTVGLPVAMMIASKGFHTIGIDRCEFHVHALRDGNWPYEDSDPLEFQDPHVCAALTNGSMAFSSDYAAAANTDVFIICVPTYVDSNGNPDLSPVDGALAKIATVAKRPVLVIIESTLPPGAMEHYSNTVIEEMRRDGTVYFTHCPQRTTLGMLFHNLAHAPRIVGGADDDCVLAWVMYKSFTMARIYTTDAATAEMVKVVENAYRFMQISFVNELALMCQAIGLDARDVIRLVNTCPERTLLQPGPGVGGPCLYKDAVYYHHGYRSMPDGAPRSIIWSAIQMNSYMAEAITDMVDDLLPITADMSHTPVAVVLGTAYRAGVRDDRNSPATAIVQALREAGIHVRTVDPVINPDADIIEVVRDTDVIIIVTCHDCIRYLDWDHIGQAMNHKLIVDTRNCLSPKIGYKPEGFTIRYLGVG